MVVAVCTSKEDVTTSKTDSSLTKDRVHKVVGFQFWTECVTSNEKLKPVKKRQNPHHATIAVLCEVPSIQYCRGYKMEDMPQTMR